jgi:hypothetical protein
MTPTDRFDDDWPRTSRPAYSPGLNPIEQVFAKINAWLRRAERRSREAFWRSAGWPSAASHPPNVATTSEIAVMHALGETALT